MSDKPKPKILMRTRRFMSNRLLNRKQFIVEVEHPGRGPVPKNELREKLASMFKVKDLNTVVVYGCHTAFGGGKSSGFGLIYDNLESCKRYEPRHRLIRLGLAKKKEGARKQKKEKKNRAKKLRGRKKAKSAAAKKK
eukprot:NODE_10487_length_590_cov_86.143469_g10208_i1.p2 GENE.NODE_10487_length_590_cov_86.143469_g10208_i1~~NODE_10487_length_590_cov_86.143469_g10208_i1.p2  ORF type:complete len:137 (+),score=51.37 NODE_10487_length_590_cov_86.143469_g10208_i1:63-473(+)